MSTANSTFIRISQSDGQWRCDGQPQVLLGRSTRAEVERWPIGFVEWNWNGHQLCASSCRYGILPVYWYADDSQIILSDRISTFLRFINSQIDPIAVALLIRLPFLLGDTTPFSGVRRLPPGARLTWTNGVLQICGERPKLSEPFCGTRQKAINLYIELFRAAIQKCMFLLTDCAMPLSGGRDSRHIVLELMAQGIRPRFLYTALHIPPRRNYDAQIAADIAKRLGLEHRIISQPPDILGQCIKHNHLVDFCTWEHTWYMAIRSYLAGQYTIVDGIGGDVLSAGLFQTHDFLDLAKRKEWETLASKILDDWGGAASKVLFRKSLLQRFSLVSALETMKKELLKCADSVNPVRDFYFWNRTRRGTALPPFRILSEPACITPYLDPDLFDFLCSLPPDISANKTFHSDVILQAYSDAADPYASEMIPLELTEQEARQHRMFWRRLAVNIALYLTPPRRRRWFRARAYKALSRAALSGEQIWWRPQRAIYAAQFSDLFD